MADVEDIAQVRAWTAERIPAAGTEADTNFTDAEIGALIDSKGKEAAAAELWSTKASLLLEGKLLEEKSIGTEKFKWMSTKDRYSLYMERSAYYGGLGAGGSQIAELDPPDVLHEDDDEFCERDLSRLVGYDND